MSLIASNSRNSFGKTINKMYTGSGKIAKTISPTNAISSTNMKLGWLLRNPVDSISQGDIINSGAGGRAFGIDILPSVRKKTAKDYV